MITLNELTSLWWTIAPQHGNSIGRRADPSHPLDFFVAFDEQNNMQFMLISEQLPDLPASSQQILVRGNVRSDGKFAICLSLVNNSLRDIYVALCWDIMDCTNNVTDHIVGTQLAIRRFRMWQLLFAELKNKKISDEGIKGLLGELFVLESLCIPLFGIDSAVSGWVGPLKADRDFEYASIWYEVKSTSRSRDAITISSYDQLDTDAPGELLVCRVEKTSREAHESVSLNKIVDQLRQLIRGNEYAASVFNNRLLLYGYDAEDERADQPYTLCGIERYLVSGEFPRIRRSLLPNAICDGIYSINLAAIQAWRVD